jgi:hypothetical protein
VRLSFTIGLLALVWLAGCSDRDVSELELAPINDDPVVFDDTFGEGVDFQAFQGSQLDAVSIDTSVKFAGTASLKVTIPGPGSQSGTFAGGAFVSGRYRDLSHYDALGFQARSNVASTLNVAGLGNDNTGNSLYTAERRNIPLYADRWTEVVIPIPDPSRLNLERGLFFFAEGFENNASSTVWFDEVSFVRKGTILSPRPRMATRTVNTFAGAAISADSTRVTVAVNGQDVQVWHSPGYFRYVSSDSTVVTTAGGAITAIGGGNAIVTAKLDTTDVVGQITVNVTAPPATPAPAPTYLAADVIALFSDAYDVVPVDTWRATWSVCGPLNEFEIAGDAVKAYTGLVYAGIEFVSHEIDATSMTHVRMDLWAPAGSQFKLKLVDFGANAVYGGGDDSQWELVFHAASNPIFTAGQWVVLDIPLTRFPLASLEHMAQIVISSPDVSTVFVDNVLFHR